MTIERYFECESCNAIGTITVSGDEFTHGDIVHCPLCSSDIYKEEENYDDE